MVEGLAEVRFGGGSTTSPISHRSGVQCRLSMREEEKEEEEDGDDKVVASPPLNRSSCHSPSHC